MTIKTHTCHVGKSKYCKPSDPPLGARGVITLKERQQEPQQTDQAESKYTQNLPVDEPHFGWDELERLEHEEEIPLGLDPGWRGGEGVGFDTQIPRENGCERPKHSECDIPSHEFPQ